MASNHTFDPSIIGAANPVLPIYSYDPYMAAVMAFLVLQTVAVLGRVYVRAWLLNSFGPDDWACVITAACAGAFEICLVTLWRISGLRSLAEVPRYSIIPTIHLMLTIELMYLVSTMGLKISLGMLLLRIFVKKWMRWTCWITIAVSCVFGTAYFGVILFQCGTPAMYPSRIILGQCLPLSVIDAMSYTHAVLTALGDLTFAILPVLYVYQTNLSSRIRWSVGGILVLGSAGCICTFIRIGWIHWLTAATLTYLVTSRGIILMSVMEVAIGLVCISLATYRPLFTGMITRRNPSYYVNRSAEGDEEAFEQGTATTMSLLSHKGKITPIITLKAMGDEENGSSLSKRTSGVPAGVMHGWHAHAV